MRSASGMRVLIDGTMARGGGGYTYLVNILPRLAALAANHQLRVLVRNKRLAAAIQPARTSRSNCCGGGMAGRCARLRDLRGSGAWARNVISG